MNELKNLDVVNIVALLKQKTGENRYQMFFNSLLGISPERIDSLILKGRKKQQSQEL